MEARASANQLASSLGAQATALKARRSDAAVISSRLRLVLTLQDRPALKFCGVGGKQDQTSYNGRRRESIEHCHYYYYYCWWVSLYVKVDMESEGLAETSNNGHYY
jgi:hypothetical protein